MPTRKTDWTAKKLDRYTKEGRGQGIGKEYKPWIEVSDFASSGRVSRILGWKTNREHHLMSDGEKRLFYLSEWSDRVTDIREQFPLLDLELCFKIAEEMGVDYNKYSKGDAPHVLTSDFMLTVTREGNSIDEARTFKLSKDLNNLRTVTKLEIERRYYARKGISWKIVTEKELPKPLLKNIEWVHSAYKLEDKNEISKENLQELSVVLISRLKSVNSTVSKLADELDKEINIESGTSLFLFKHLVANKLISGDMLTQNTLSFLPTQEIKFNK